MSDRFQGWSRGNGFVRPRIIVALELNVLALYKGDEKYVFVYDAESREHLLNEFRNLAADPRRSLNWFDAAVLAQKLREQCGEATQPEPQAEPRAGR